MSTPINLNTVRKDRERAKRKARAAENVVVHGRSKAEKDAEKAKNERIIQAFEAHKRDE